MAWGDRIKMQGLRRVRDSKYPLSKSLRGRRGARGPGARRRKGRGIRARKMSSACHASYKVIHSSLVAPVGGLFCKPKDRA